MKEKGKLVIGKLTINDIWINEQMDSTVIAEVRLCERSGWGVQFNMDGNERKTLHTKEGGVIKGVKIGGSHYIDPTSLEDHTCFSLTEGKEYETYLFMSPDLMFSRRGL